MVRPTRKVIRKKQDLCRLLGDPLTKVALPGASGCRAALRRLRIGGPRRSHALAVRARGRTATAAAATGTPAVTVATP